MTILKKLSFLLLLVYATNVKAQLVFQNLEHDYGKVSKAKSLLSEFVVTNTGSEDAIILRIDAGGSFAFKYDQIVIKPGKSDTIKLFLKPTRAGRFNEDVSVFLSSQDKPVVLNIKGELSEVDKDPLGQCFSFRENHPDVYKALAITDQQITIIDNQTKLPISGAFVQLFNSNNKSYFMYTKENGTVSLAAEPNLYDIKLSADYYKGLQAEQYLSKDARITLSMERLPDAPNIITPETIKVDTFPQKVAVPTIDTIIASVPVAVVLPDTVKKEEVIPVKETIEPPVVKPDLVNGELNPEIYVPSNVVFLIDLSSSMNEPKKLPLLKKSMKTLLSTMRAIDKITIVVYAENARVILPPTNVVDKDVIYKLIDGLTASGLTAANRALRTAYDINSKSFIDGGNNQIILATDGMFNLSKLDEEMMIRNSTADKKIICSVVAFGNSIGAKAKLSTMAVNGKGDYLDISDESMAREALLNEIKSKSRR